MTLEFTGNNANGMVKGRQYDCRFDTWNENIVVRVNVASRKALPNYLDMMYRSPQAFAAVWKRPEIYQD